MAERPPFVDIHLHPVLKAFNSSTREHPVTPWDVIEHIEPTTGGGRFVRKNTPDLAKYSQSSFGQLMRGNVRVAMNSLYPFERGFMDLRNVPKLFTGKQAQYEMTAVVAGMAVDRVAELGRHCDYFKELNDEYRYLKDHQGPSPDGTWSYRIARHWGDVQESLAKGDELAVVNTVEGCHSLFDADMLQGRLGKPDLKRRLTEHIEQIKSWEHPPFFMNLMHHFDNGLGGHARSLKAQVGNNLLNQNKGLEAGLNGLGIKALKELLSDRNGPRILIDTKHMSLRVRKEYYNWIRSFNYISKNDRIPVICSHGWANGFKTMSGSQRRKDNTAKVKRSRFFNWSINLSDEELRIMHDSGGILGLIVDKGKVGGGAFHDRLEGIEETEKRRSAYMKLMWDNIFHIIQAISKPTAWDILTIGTDYDGAINHVEFYDTAETMPTWYEDLYRYLERNKPYKKYWYGYTAREIMDKIFSRNAMDFMQRHFDR